VANILGIQTVYNLLIINTDTDPTIGSGVSAPIGSIVIASDGSGIFNKIGVLNTDWGLNTKNIKVLSIKSSINNTVFEVDNYVLVDAMGDQSIEFGTYKILIDASTSTVSLNWLNRQVLNSNGIVVLDWEKGSIKLGYVEKTSTYTITTDDYTINCISGTFQVTLLLSDASNIGQIFNIKNTGLGTITLSTTSSQTIDGSITQIIPSGSSIAVQSTGAGWIII
jgi:hypothetical protein